MDIQDRVVSFESKYSRFARNNWLEKLNREKQAVPDTDALIMLQYALKIAKQSNGVFDPTITPKLEEIGYASQASPSDYLLGYRHIHLNTEAPSIRLDPHVRIEFGGVGKGYMIDIIAKMLDRAGYDRFLIDF